VKPVTVVIVVVLAAVWGVVAVNWWRSRTGGRPLLAKKDGSPRWSPSQGSTALGVTGVLAGLLNLAVGIAADSGWSFVAGGAFLVIGASGFIEARRRRALEVRDSPAV